MSLTKTDKTFIKSQIKSQFKPLEKRVGSLEDKTDILNKKVDSLDKKVDSLDKKVDDKTDILGKKTDILSKKYDILSTKTDLLTDKYLLLSNRVERGFKEAAEDRAKFRDETLNGFDQILTEIREMRQEKEVLHHKVYKNLDPRVTKLELSQTNA